MSSKLNDSFESISYNPEIVAGAYVHRRMEEFVNTIHAASYPHPPEQTGGKVYVHCRNYLEQCADKLDESNPSNLSPEVKVSLRAHAIESLGKLVDDLGKNTSLNASEKCYLDEFIFIKAVTDKILAGKSLDELRDFIESAPIGQPQTPEP